MKSLLYKNLSRFIIYTIIILLCSSPLFFIIIKYFYTEDLDELIEYRYEEFKDIHLSDFKVADIDSWNKFNEDLQILPYDKEYKLKTNLQEYFFNKAEGHTIEYRIIYNEISIEGETYILSSRVPMIETHDLVWTLVTQYGLLLLVLLISLTIIQRFMSERLWSPFYDSLGLIEKFNLEQGIVPEFGKTDIKEFARLNEILSTLITNNLKIYKQQKEFIENASHELQTPLAVFQSQLDILLQQPDLTESQVEIIQSLYSVSSRLTRLNKNLLLLAKIDNAQFKEMQEIEFNRLLESYIAYFLELAESNSIRISVEINNPLVVIGNKVLLESLMNNLIVNAIRHNVENGSISVNLTGHVFSVKNTGEAQALNPEKIFRRFSRTSEKKKGNGLGLSIVSQICKYHGWKINYSYQPDGMHYFEVEF